MQLPILLQAFFLELLEDKHHVCCALVASETTLVLWKVFFSDCGYQSVQQNSCKDFSCDGEQSNPPVIGAVRVVPFVIVESNDN